MTQRQYLELAAVSDGPSREEQLDIVLRQILNDLPPEARLVEPGRGAHGARAGELAGPQAAVSNVIPFRPPPQSEPLTHLTYEKNRRGRGREWTSRTEVRK